MFESHLKPPISFPTVSGAVCNFISQYNGLPLKSHKIALTARQSGSGTPSPYNERPIIGYSTINISRSGEDTSIPTVYIVNLDGTYYFGEYDAVSGVFIPSHIGVDLGSLTWTYDSQYTRFKSQNNLPYLSARPAIRTIPIMCSCYMEISDGRPLSQVPDFSIYVGGETRAAFVRDSRYTDPNDFRTAVSGQYVVYPILSPYTGDAVQLSPCPIDTLIGVNNIWADTGDSTISYIKLG